MYIFYIFPLFQQSNTKRPSGHCGLRATCRLMLLFLAVWPCCCRSSLRPLRRSVSPLCSPFTPWMVRRPLSYQTLAFFRSSSMLPSGYAQQTLPTPSSLIALCTIEWRVPLFGGLLNKAPPLRSKAWRNSRGETVLTLPACSANWC